MDIVQLKYVVELVKECNFSRAANNLFITQPALSQQIRKLEEEIGFSLFYRDTKHVTPTAAGEKFAAYAGEILEKFENLSEYVRQTAQSFSEAIVFATSPNSSELISPCIPEFIAKYPNVKFSYFEAWDFQLIEMLKKNELDIALVLWPKKQFGIQGIRLLPICEDQLCVAVDAEDILASREEVCLEDIQDRRCVYTSVNSIIKQMVLSEFDPHGKLDNNTLIIAERNSRLPLIKRGAVYFSLYQRRKHKDTGVVPIMLNPRIEAVFCLALPENIKITEEKRAFIQIASRMIRESLKSCES